MNLETYRLNIKDKNKLIGKKVVCIKDEPDYNLIENKVYTISEVSEFRNTVKLKELPTRWNMSRFEINNTIAELFRWKL